MMRFLKLAVLLVAFWVVTPLAWLERFVTGGRKLHPFERILTGTAFLGTFWSGWLLVVYLPHFERAVADLGVSLPIISNLILSGPTFEIAAITTALTTIVAARLRPLPDWARSALLGLCAFSGIAIAQIVRFGMVMPFMTGGCPH